MLPHMGGAANTPGRERFGAPIADGAKPGAQGDRRPFVPGEARLSAQGRWGEKDLA